MRLSERCLSNSTIEGVSTTELPSLYREVDHAIEDLFKTPPSSAAQMEIAFS
ncbi:MAG: HalOD1 output domain-containing protein [Halosimplex sp.]